MIFRVYEGYDADLVGASSDAPKVADAGVVALKPCPFCNGPKIALGYIRDGQTCACSHCGARTHAFEPGAADKAIAKWNTRRYPEVMVEQTCFVCGDTRPPEDGLCRGCDYPKDEQPDTPKEVSTPEDLRIINDHAKNLMQDGATSIMLHPGTILHLLDCIAALEAENRRVREALSDSATVHVNILRGTIALTKAQAIHIAGLPADIEQKLEQLKEQVRKLSAPVSDDELIALLKDCPSEGEHMSARFNRLLATRTQEPAQTEGK